MELRALSKTDMEQIRLWRNSALETLRTPYELTAEMQEDYYRTVICDRRSTTRYWGVRIIRPASELGYDENADTLIGYGGIENIEWENSTGEISLLVGPYYRKKGYGREAAKMILDRAFNQLNLHTVHGECYICAPWEFWQKLVGVWPGRTGAAILSCRKYWNGKYYDSYYFTFWRPDGATTV